MLPGKRRKFSLSCWKSQSPDWVLPLQGLMLEWALPFLLTPYEDWWTKFWSTAELWGQPLVLPLRLLKCCGRLSKMVSSYWRYQTRPLQLELDLKALTGMCYGSHTPIHPQLQSGQMLFSISTNPSWLTLGTPFCHPWKKYFPFMEKSLVLYKWFVWLQT